MLRRLTRYIPIADWGPRYARKTAASDLFAAIIVTLMLIPQSLAYALLAGLPPVVGLYASIGPLVAYAIFGTSRTLSVGPVAVVSLLTAAAASQVAEPGSAEYLGAAIALALLSGVSLFLFGILRLGFIVNFLSHPVISGFITASGILIAASQLKHIFGVEAQGHTLATILASLSTSISNVNFPTLFLGVGALAFLVFARTGLKPMLDATGLRSGLTKMIVKGAPVLAIIGTGAAVALFDLKDAGVAVVGAVPGGLPSLVFPDIDMDLWRALAPAALLISLIGYVESVSVGQTLAAKRRERIDPNQELIGLGAANAVSGLAGGFPVTGGFSRSVVNFDAGAQTQAASIFTAVGIAGAALFLTPLFQWLPIATLAATIIVAVLSLVDIKSIVRSWRYSRGDFSAVMATIVVTLAAGVEAGVMTGVFVSIAIHLYHSSKPHFAVVGLVPGTEHFRNVRRHEVLTSSKVLSLRIDGSLYFASARFLEDTVANLLARHQHIEHFVLMCSAVNEIDGSALESLETINERLSDHGVKLHLSEVKGPVMDRLKRSQFLKALTGHVFLSQFDALKTLDPAAINGPANEESDEPAPEAARAAQ